MKAKEGICRLVDRVAAGGAPLARVTAVSAAAGAAAFCALDVRGDLVMNVGWGAVFGMAALYLAVALPLLAGVLWDLYGPC